MQKVLAEGDLLDGQTVRDVLIGPDSLEDDHLAMTVLFDDGSMAIYVVDLTTFEEFDQGEAGGDGVVPDLFGLGCLAPGATVTLETRDGPPGAAAIMVVGTTLGQSTVGGGTLLVIRRSRSPTRSTRTETRPASSPCRTSRASWASAPSCRRSWPTRHRPPARR